VITVEGTDKEISDILSTFERTTAVGQAKVAIAHGRAAKKEQKKRASVSDLVVTLKEEGFFDKAERIVGYFKCLEEQGYICPVTTLSAVMLA